MTPEDMSTLRDSADRLADSVAALSGTGWTKPSLLPGWDRRTLLAHLALNAEALTGVLTSGGARPMYTSQASRDADIADLGAAEAAVVGERLEGATTSFLDALESVEDWTVSFERTPGALAIPLTAVAAMRLREVEIHHVDLDVDYRCADWTPSFAVGLIELWAERAGDDVALVATDVDRSFGHGVTITGTAADLAWWLSGRGHGEQLITDDGVLPKIGAL